MPRSKHGAYGIVAIYEEVILFVSESKKDTTNNQMELLAVIESLKLLKEVCEVNIYSDSKYVVENIRHNRIYEWKKNNFKKIKNADMWKELIKYLKIQQVKIQYVKGHKDNTYNNMCHDLAYFAAKNMQVKTKKYMRKIGGKNNEKDK